MNSKAPWISRIIDPIKKAVAEEEAQDEQIHFENNVFPTEKAEQYVAWNLRVAAAWSWRLLLVIATVVLALWAILKIQVIVIPLFIALMMSVLLLPVFNLLKHYLRLPRSIAAGISLIFGIIMLFGLIYLASSQIVFGISDLVVKAQRGLTQLVSDVNYGLHTYLHFNDTQTENFMNNLNSEFTAYIKTWTSGLYLYTNALAFTSSVFSVLTGMLLTLFATFFFLKDGRKIWLWIVRLLPQEARISVHEAGIRGWITLTSYVRAQIIIAAVDAVSIGIGAYLIGVPLAIPLTVLVFLGSFIPIVGALFSGMIAVLVAFVDNGISNAILMCVIILLVQQLEGNLLQPLIMSSSVDIHPLAVLLSVTSATYLLGIVGALFVVPIVAFVNTAVLYLHGYDKFPHLKSSQTDLQPRAEALETAISDSLSKKEKAAVAQVAQKIQESMPDHPALHDDNLTDTQTQLYKNDPPAPIR